MDKKPRLVTVDDRRRISLGWAKLKANFYTVTVEPDGTIILTPVDISPIGVTITEEEQ